MPGSWRVMLRGLARSPGFALAAVLTLALGAGINIAMFAIIDAVMLRPISLPEPDRLAMLYAADNHPRGDWHGMNPRRLFADNVRLERWAALSRSFESMGGYRGWRSSVTGHGTPERVDTIIVVGDLFRVLEVKPEMGRAFLPEEVRDGGTRVAILSHAYWQQHFAGDRNVLGRTIMLDGYPYTIVGVMPRGFAPVLPGIWRHAGIWTTAAVDFTSRGLFGGRAPVEVCQAIGRLRHGVTLAQAQSEMNVIAKALLDEGGRQWGPDIDIVAASGEAAENLRPALMALFAAVGCVLLIACANIAGLALARQSVRQRETAIRAVLGASRARLMRESLTESLVISVAGSALGLLAAHWLLEALRLFSPIDFDTLGDLRMDGLVVVFVLGLSLGSALLFGLLPAISASRSDLNTAVKEAAAARGSAGTLSARSVLTASEVALAAALLIAAGLLLKSFANLRGVDTGFESSHLISAEVPLPTTAYGKPAQLQALVDALAPRLERIPGVESAGFTDSMALTGSWMMSGNFTIDGAPPREKTPEADLVAASPGYFHASGTTLVAGRYFTDAEARTGRAVLINETGAKQYFGGVAQAVGRSIRGDICPSCTIVGVIRDLRNHGLKNESAAELFGPLASMPCPSLDIAVRTYSDPALLVPAVRAALAAAAPDLAIEHIGTMRDTLGEAMAEPRFNAILVALFAVLALVLAAVGVFGVTSSWVTQRTREIGVRIALGAEVGRVRRMVLRQSLMTGGAGVAAGIGVALIVTRLLRSLLFGVTANDPATFVVVTVAMLTIIVIAAWRPARRASRVDPIAALRHE